MTLSKTAHTVNKRSTRSSNALEKKGAKPSGIPILHLDLNLEE